MTNDEWTLPASGIATVDPSQVSRFLCKHYLVMVSKANRDQLVEFCHLVVLLDLKNHRIPQTLATLVSCVMKNPQPDQVREAVWKLKEHADSLNPDPRKASSDVANAWRQSKEIREGKAVKKLDESLLSQSSSSSAPSKSQIPIEVQVWPHTQGKLDKPASEIRCAVPSLSMVGNLENIIRYAASAGFNFPLPDGKRRPKAEKLSSQAMLFSRSSGREWVLRDKPTTLGEVVEHSRRLQIVNTKLKTLAVAVVVGFRQELSEHFLFDIHKPLNLVDTLHTIVAKPQVLRNIDLAGRSFIQTRFLTILPEEVALPPATSRNRDRQADPYTIHHTSITHSTGAPLLGSSVSDSPRAAPLAAHPQSQIPSAKAGLPEIVGAQPPVDHRIDNLRSPSPASSHYSDAQEDVEPPGSEVHGYARIQHPARTLPNAPSTNPMPVVPASSSSSIVVVPSVTQSATLSSPENKAIVTPEVPAQKPAPDSFFKKIRRKIGW